MSTEKSLKHLKSKDEFLVANVSNYFEKHSGRDSLHVFNILFRQLGSAEEPFSEYKKNFEKPAHFHRCNVRNGRQQYKPVDDLDEVVIRNNVQEFYIHRHPLPTINNLLSVLKTDIMSTIHQN